MKRIAIVFLLVGMIGTMLTGCGAKEEPRQGKEPNKVGAKVVFEDKEPTEAEYNALHRYAAIIDALTHYNPENGDVYIDTMDENNVYVSYSGREAIQFCVEQLNNLSIVDKWIGTEYCVDFNNNVIHYTRQDLLDGFMTIRDILLEQHSGSTDAVGNTKVDETKYYQYDTNANMIYTDAFVEFSIIDWCREYVFGATSVQNTYDENGVFVKSTGFFNNGDIAYVITPTYENGRKIAESSVHWDGREANFNYYYDNIGRVVSVVAEGSGIHSKKLTFNYTYDDSGNIIRKELVDGFDQYLCVDFVYSNDGKTMSATIPNTLLWFGNYAGDLTATFDDQGRILTWKIGTSNDAINYTYMYGDYYFFMGLK